MKSILTFVLILVSVSLFAQDDVYGPAEKKSDGPQVPKKTWKILIKTSLSADENFTLVGRTLADNDLQIETKDKEFYTIKTAPQEVGKAMGRYFLNFSIRDKVIAVTGQANADISITVYGVKQETQFEKIINKGSRSSCMSLAFIKMNDFAQKLGNDVEYIVD